MHKKIRVDRVIPEIYFLLSFLVFTVFVNVGLVVLYSLLFVLIISMKNKSLLLVEETYVILLFYILPFVSVAISLITVFICGYDYIRTYPERFGRLINIGCNLFFFVFIVDKINRKTIHTEKMVKIYLVGCYILLFFGIWQLANLIFNIPYPDFNTRDNIHSMNTEELFPFMTKRITSISREPAFLVPYLMDAIILIMYLYKNNIKKILFILLFVLLLLCSLSLSGYINGLIIFFFMFLFSKNKTAKYFIFFAILCLIISSPIIIQDAFLPVFGRLNSESLLKSTRIVSILMPVQYMVQEASFFNLLLGFGPKGMVYLRQIIGFSQEMKEGTTSTLYTEFFIDYGIVGILIIFVLFFYLFFLARKTYHLTKSRLSEILCINIFVTSLYTTDFANPHFTIILLFILFLYKDAVVVKLK